MAPALCRAKPRGPPESEGEMLGMDPELAKQAVQTYGCAARAATARPRPAPRPAPRPPRPAPRPARCAGRFTPGRSARRGGEGGGAPPHPANPTPGGGAADDPSPPAHPEAHPCPWEGEAAVQAPHCPPPPRSGATAPRASPVVPRTGGARERWNLTWAPALASRPGSS